MPISLHLRGGDLDSPAVEAAVSAAFGVLEVADELFSTYRPGSEVALIGRGELVLADAHPFVREVAAVCDQAREATDGAFTDQLPGPDGARRFDPTGVVKGWAADRAAAVLSDALADTGHTFCLNCGGDVVVGGAGDREPWRVGIEDPRDRSQMAEVVTIDHGAVATSGTAARGAHIFDPTSGTFVERHGSVTVVATSLTWADIWATALFVGSPGLAQRASEDARVTSIITL